MNILVTLDKNYLPPLKTMLMSLFINHPVDSFDVYLASDNLTEDNLGDVSNLCRRFHSALHLIHVKDEWFADAPTLRYYSRAMYDRLLAAQLLLLPDQDILNGLYGEYILPVDESLWNYDARKYNEYLIASSGEKDMDWVMRNTAILHFCGKRKPWHKDYHGRFSALYKHYRNLAERCEETIFQIEMED